MLSLVVYADKPRTVLHVNGNITRVIREIDPRLCEKVIENWGHTYTRYKMKPWRLFERYCFPYIMPLNVLSHKIKISTISHIHLVLFRFNDLLCLLENPCIRTEPFDLKKTENKFRCFKFTLTNNSSW